jgi:hypothetical protein
VPGPAIRQSKACRHNLGVSPKSSFRTSKNCRRCTLMLHINPGHAEV